MSTVFAYYCFFWTKYLPQFDYNFIVEDLKKSSIEKWISLFQGIITILILESRFLVLTEISAELLP